MGGFTKTLPAFPDLNTILVFSDKAKTKENDKKRGNWHFHLLWEIGICRCQQGLHQFGAGCGSEG